ncbi:MAG: hypothetical protein ACREDO_02480 [Methyloceanibacter sp.]
MKRPIVAGAPIALVAVLAGLTLHAADTLTWPWKDKKPADPALALLSKIDELVVSVSATKPQALTISVKASAPTSGFTELQLTPRIGDPKDLIFAFDARGRSPQDTTTQVITPVTINAVYGNAPLGSVRVIEVYAQDNCKAYSLKDKSEVPCTQKSGPQQTL